MTFKSVDVYLIGIEGAKDSRFETRNKPNTRRDSDNKDDDDEDDDGDDDDNDDDDEDVRD